MVSLTTDPFRVHRMNLYALSVIGGIVEEVVGFFVVTWGRQGP